MHFFSALYILKLFVLFCYKFDEYIKIVIGNTGNAGWKENEKKKQEWGYSLWIHSLKNSTINFSAHTCKIREFTELISCCECV